MARDPINTGTVPGDGTGDKLYEAFGKVNANETELYANVDTAQATADGAQSDATQALSDASDAQTTADNLEATKEDKGDSIERDNLFSKTESLEIMDALGRIMARVDADGIETTNVTSEKVTTSEILGIVSMSLDYLRTQSIVSDSDEGYFVTSKLGKILFKIGLDGIVDYYNRYKHRLEGKNFKSLGDSLSQPELYEEAFAEKTRAIFMRTYSWGGSNSIPNDSTSFHDRVNMLLDDAGGEDFVLLENVNDSFFVDYEGSIESPPFLAKNYTYFSNGFVSKAAADSYWSTNFQDVVDTVTVEAKGEVVRLEYDTVSVSIQITSSATSDGSIVIDVGGTGYSTAINNGDTPSEIATKLEITNYVGYSKSVVNGDTLRLVKTDSGAGAVSISVNDTGATTSQTSSTSTAYSNRYFLSDNLSDFNNSEFWTAELNLYSSYKGFIEAISKERPDVEIMWVMPNKFYLVWDENHPNYNPAFWNDDGTLNTYAYYSQEGLVEFRKLIDIQKEVCEYYGVKYADCNSKSGLNILNIQDGRYNEADVHPIPDGGVYEIWADVMKQYFN